MGDGPWVDRTFKGKGRFGAREEKPRELGFDRGMEVLRRVRVV